MSIVKWTLDPAHSELSFKIRHMMIANVQGLYKNFIASIEANGDQFRGGDGMVGALGPILRGDHKKRSRNGQIGLEYDTMLLTSEWNGR